MASFWKHKPGVFVQQAKQPRQGLMSIAVRSNEAAGIPRAASQDAALVEAIDILDGEAQRLVVGQLGAFIFSPFGGARDGFSARAALPEGRRGPSRG